MIPKIGTQEAERQVVRLAELARLAPERRQRVLQFGILTIERNAKRIARSGGLFSRRSTGTLARSLRGHVVSATSAVLTVGTQYGVIQDVGGQTKPHRIEPRFKKALAFPSGPGGYSNAARIGSGRKLARIGSRRISTALAAGKSVTGMTVVRGVNHPGSRIPGVRYSWKAYLLSRDAIRGRIGAEMLGRTA